MHIIDKIVTAWGQVCLAWVDVDPNPELSDWDRRDGLR